MAKYFYTILYVGLFILGGICFSPMVVSAAATVFLETTTKALGVGDVFAVQVVLTNDTETVNAISGDIAFDDTTMSVQSVLSAPSIIPLWIDTPHVSGNAVVFSGIIPGGYQSLVDPVTQNQTRGIVTTIIFKVKNPGESSLEFNDVHVLKNDGFGTEDQVQALPLDFNFTTQGNNYVVTTVDTIPPETFIPLVVQDQNMYSGKYVAIFTTNDKQSGIDHYEIKEGNTDWVRAESPYVLLDQSGTSELSIKAVDLAGNYQIETIAAKHFYATYIVSLLAALSLCILLLLHRAYVRYHKKKIRK